nr:helix-turn-helix domain-containing protein [Bacillus sp. FJAT-50079]
MPIKLDILADIIHVSIHTIRTELENINLILSERDAQVIVSKKGQCYLEDKKKDAVRSLLINPIYVDKNNIANHIVWDRIYTIIGMLSFEADYISMEELAERLYVSKSTINLDITEIKRIIGRISGISFIVSNTKGLKLKGNEEDFRYFLAKMIVQGLNLESVLQYLFPAKDFDISDQYERMNKVLREIMVKHQFIISGKAFGLVGASLLICALRNELGCHLTHTKVDETLLPMTKEIEERLKKETGVAFTYSDIVYIQQIIMEQNHLYTNEEWNVEDRHVVSIFTHVVKDFLQIDLKNDPQFAADFTFYINQLNQRVKNGHDYTNFYKRQINRLFPMTASIVAFCQPHLKELGMMYSDAELAYITLFLGNFIETDEPVLKLLFISDEHTALVNWIASEVQRLMGSSVQIVKTIPRYLFEENNDLFLQDVDVILTTDNIHSMYNRDVIFIHSLFSKAEQDFLSSLLNKYLEQLKMKGLRDVENMAIGKEHFFQTPESCKELDQCVRYLLEQAGEQVSVDDGVNMDNQFIPNDTKIAYVSFMTRRPGQSKIIVGKLSKSIYYRNKAINMIIISIYHANDDAFACSFYQCIRFLMDPVQNHRLGKVKDYADFKQIFD